MHMKCVFKGEQNLNIETGEVRLNAKHRKSGAHKQKQEVADQKQ